jgi:uncharacterized integral membrane protein
MRKDVFEKLGQWLFSVSDSVRDGDGDIIQTERATEILFGVAKVAMAVIATYAIFFQLSINEAQLSAVKNGFTFFAWALGVAMAAWLGGCLLGLLFGLPSVVEIKVTDNREDNGGENQQGSSLGYRESTNLEQVADWVTKILIGLALTQYYWLQTAFEVAFEMASRLMTGEKESSAAPAAIIAIGFAINGFLIAYLMMRRYFITEMVAGRSDARAKETKAQAAIRAATSAGLIQKKSSVTTEPAQQVSDALSMAQTVATIASGDSARAARAIAEQSAERGEFPDDPWRGKFGGSNKVDDCSLTAEITPLTGNDQFFTVKLNLTTTEPPQRNGQSATFYLHPTFGPDPKKVAFTQGGIATLELIAYGAFTVGVLLEDGKKLELNLATLADKPELELFRLR